ncbi:MAG: hypothetical protein WA064_04435 [Candidatus Moraniibacteriota bacterium]|jgi:PP-loop superfamily ATP-utilizing enzyme
MKIQKECRLAQEAIEALTESLCGIPNGFDGRAVLMFSGGRDSSAVAAAYCHAFPESQLHLFFVDNGLLSRTESTERQARLIKNLFPETDVQFHTRRVSQMMRIAGMQEVEKDFKENGYSTLLICVACKLIMNFAAIRFAKELSTSVVLDGYAERQAVYPEQTVTFMNFVRDLFKQNDMIYLSPLYRFLSHKEKVNHALKELGVRILKQEPVCMWANAFSEAKEDEIEKYLRKTSGIILEHDNVLRPGDMSEPVE